MFVPAGAGFGVPLANALSGADPATATPSTPAVCNVDVKRFVGTSGVHPHSGENLRIISSLDTNSSTSCSRHCKV